MWHPIHYFKKIISNSKVVTEEGKYALDATQNNPDVEGSLRNELNAISTKIKDRIGPFHVRYCYLSTETNVKIDIMPSHNEIFFFGELNNSPVSGVVARNGATINKAPDASSNVGVTVDVDNGKVIFALTTWSGIFLISTYPITVVEIY